MRTKSPEVRERLLAAAEQVFAEDGYRGATVAGIAKRAGVSTGNVYRYFANKDALFYAIFTDAFAEAFLGLLERRVGALVGARALTALEPGELRAGEELLAFWIEHRLKVVTLLDRAEGSTHEGFRGRFVEALLRPTTEKLEAESRAPLSPEAQVVLRNIFTNTVRMIVAILEAHEEPEAVRRAFEGFWSYQLAGLDGFSKWVTS